MWYCAPSSRVSPIPSSIVLKELGDKNGVPKLRAEEEEEEDDDLIYIQWKGHEGHEKYGTSQTASGLSSLARRSFKEQNFKLGKPTLALAPFKTSSPIH